jgi:guanylate kinase
MVPVMNSISLVVSAPSGAGKTTIIRRLMQEDDRLAFSVSTTTRSKRIGEVEGVSYYYTDHETFEKLIQEGAFAEWAKVYNNYYGTTKKEIDRIKADGKIPVFDVDVVGAMNLRTSLNDAVLMFIMPPSIDSLVERLRQRNTESEEELQTRISNAIKEMRQYRSYDYFVINDHLDDAVNDAKSIIRAELLKRTTLGRNVDAILEEKK